MLTDMPNTKIAAISVIRLNTAPAASTTSADPTSATVNIERSLMCLRSQGDTTVPANPPEPLARIRAPSTHAGSPSARKEKPNWNSANPTAARSTTMSHTAPDTSGRTSSTNASRPTGSSGGATARTRHATTVPPMYTSAATRKDQVPDVLAYRATASAAATPPANVAVRDSRALAATRSCSCSTSDGTSALRATVY